MEIWKDIKGFKDYQVSSLGRVKSLKYGKERILITRPSKYMNGYIYVGLKNGAVLVHQLMAIAFLGHTPCGHKLVVDHIDNNKLNNSISNLQIITHRENTSKDKYGGASKYVGVAYDKSRSKWKASIKIDGKNKFIGRYKRELDAHYAYQQELKKL